ncbi:Uncharacterised protein [Bordetella ansorpii]|uniref:Type III secretion system flagellar brake protein YcgR PilZN domain-containing protein n=1 Tax=Bordetella ansorpii TaxID=288768 RepID=A0A157M0Y7_9BORD|nr:flagellar regulator YcgR PilZN domain-containing protein [Bordetella ansorpii]SAI02733.1 Uncharacterised protein [Bordetella ansorpii]
MHSATDPSDHESWLQSGSDIRHALSSLSHPASLVQARDDRGMQWAVRVLGLDARSRLFFWRPDGTDVRQADTLAQRLASAPLEFTAKAHDGAWMQFRTERPSVVRFDDGSMLMVSPFPTRLRREFGAH